MEKQNREKANDLFRRVEDLARYIKDKLVPNEVTCPSTGEVVKFAELLYMFSEADACSTEEGFEKIVDRIEGIVQTWETIEFKTDAPAQNRTETILGEVRKERARQIEKGRTTEKDLETFEQDPRPLALLGIYYIFIGITPGCHPGPLREMLWLGRHFPFSVTLKAQRKPAEKLLIQGLALIIAAIEMKRANDKHREKLATRNPE